MRSMGVLSSIKTFAKKVGESIVMRLLERGFLQLISTSRWKTSNQKKCSKYYRFVSVYVNCCICVLLCVLVPVL